MIRGRCDDCGSWFRGDRPFCPDCGTLGSGAARRTDGSGYYVRGWRRLISRVSFPMGWHGWFRLWDMLASFLYECLSLMLGKARWVPLLLSSPPSFSRIEPARVKGLNLARLERVRRTLDELGFQHACTYLVPEEGELTVYELAGRPGETTWALAQIPAPARVDSANWRLSLHSLLANGTGLITQSFEEEVAEEAASFRVMCVQGEARDLFTAHRQEVFHAGGARHCRGLARNGLFFRHHSRWIMSRVESLVASGAVRRGRGGNYRHSCYLHPWTPALRSCSQCQLPVCDTCLTPFSGGALCRECSEDRTELSPRGRTGFRALLAELIDRGLEAGLALGGLALLSLEGSPGPLLLSWPVVHGLHDSLSGGRTLGRRLLGVRLVGEDGRPLRAWEWSLRTTLWWVGAVAGGAGFAPLLAGRSPLHDAGVGARAVLGS